MTNSQIAAVLQMEIPLVAASLTRTLGPLSAAIPGAEDDLTGVLAVLTKLDTTLDAVAEDANLSPQGKLDGSEKAARVALAALDAFVYQKVVAGLERRRDSVLAGVLPEPKPSADLGDRLVAEMRAAAIRETFRPLDPLERTYVYLSTDDQEIRTALESAPAAVVRLRPGDMPTLQPFIDATQVRAQVLARAEQRDPVAAGQLRDLETLASVYRSVVASARAAVVEAVPSLAPSDPILM